MTVAGVGNKKETETRRAFRRNGLEGEGLSGVSMKSNVTGAWASVRGGGGGGRARARERQWCWALLVTS